MENYNTLQDKLALCDNLYYKARIEGNEDLVIKLLSLRLEIKSAILELLQNY